MLWHCGIDFFARVLLFLSWLVSMIYDIISSEHGGMSNTQNSLIVLLKKHPRPCISAFLS